MGYSLDHPVRKGHRSRCCLIGLLSLAAFVVLTLAASPASAADPGAALDGGNAVPAAPPAAPEPGVEPTPAVDVKVPVQPAPAAEPPEVPAPAPSVTKAVASAPKADAASVPTPDVPTPKVRSVEVDGLAAKTAGDLASSTGDAPAKVVSSASGSVQSPADTVGKTADGLAGGGAPQPPTGLGGTALALQLPTGLEPLGQSAGELLSTAQDIGGVLGNPLVPTSEAQGPLPSLTSFSPTHPYPVVSTSSADSVGANGALLPWSLFAAGNQIPSAASAPELTGRGGNGSIPGPSGPLPSAAFGAGGSTGTGLIFLLGLLAAFVIGLRSLHRRLDLEPARLLPALYTPSLERPG